MVPVVVVPVVGLAVPVMDVSVTEVSMVTDVSVVTDIVSVVAVSVVYDSSRLHPIKASRRTQTIIAVEVDALRIFKLLFAGNGKPGRKNLAVYIEVG